jgi:hypothetical protein
VVTIGQVIDETLDVITIGRVNDNNFGQDHRWTGIDEPLDVVTVEKVSLNAISIGQGIEKKNLGQIGKIRGEQ